MTEYGYDISDMKAFTDESLSVEIPIESVPKDALEKILGGVAIIRCKDCIHNVSNRITDPLCINDYSGDDIVCDYFETDGMEPDDYCSYAERKEE